MIGRCHQTDLFPSRGRLKLVLVRFCFCFFLLSTFVLFCEKLVTLIFSVVQKEKRWLQLTQIWNSKEMGHTDGKQQCGDFTGKRSPCSISGHLSVTYSSISCDHAFDFPRHGFERPQSRNSSFKNAYLQLCLLQSMLYTDIKHKISIKCAWSWGDKFPGYEGARKDLLCFLRSSSNCNFVDFGKLPFSPFSFCHHFCFIRKQEPICFLYEKKMFFSCIYMQANNSKQHVNLRQYIKDFKNVFTNGIYSSQFQPLLLLHWGVS